MKKNVVQYWSTNTRSFNSQKELLDPENLKQADQTVILYLVFK